MADVIGHAEIETTIDLDTTRVRAQGRAAAREAGKQGEAAGDSYVDGFTKKYTKEMKGKFKQFSGKSLAEVNKDAGVAGGKAGDSFAVQMEKRYARKMQDLFFKSYERDMRAADARAKTGGDDSGKSFATRFSNAIKKGNIFSGLDDEVKLVIGLIAATFSETAGLASGLSASLVALVAGLAQAAAGLSAVAAVLPGVAYGFALAQNGLERIDELAPKAAGALDNLKDAFENADVPFFMAEWEDSLANFANTLAESLRFDTIAQNLGRATADITDAFTAILNSPAWTSFVAAMETSIPDAITGFGVGVAGLTSAFLSFAAAAGPAASILGAEFAAWGQSIADAVQAANESGALTQFLIDAGETLGIVLDLVGSLGTALAGVFSAAAPAAQVILGYLAQLAEQFSTWANSLEGQNALAAWFDQGLVVLNALMPLISTVATEIANLVTPEVIAQLVTFITSLTGLIPIVAQVLQLFSDLNVLGIVAALFDAIRVALEPVMPQLSELATTLGQALITAITGLSPLLSALVQVVLSLQPALNELLPIVADLIAELGVQLAPIVAELAPLITDLLNAFIPLVPELADALIPIIEFLVANLDITIQTLNFLIPVIASVVTSLLPFIQTLTAIIKTVLPPLTNALNWVADSFRAMKPLITAVTTAIQNAARPFKTFIDGLSQGKSVGVAFGEAVRDAMQWIVDSINSVVSALRNIRWPSPPSWLTNGFNNTIGRFFAEGGMVNGPTRAIIGEAGPEMVIPLARPLSQIDPAVREVAAFAQGKSPMMARGGQAGGGINVQSVQIVSPWANNPRLIAQDFLDGLVLAGK